MTIANRVVKPAALVVALWHWFVLSPEDGGDDLS
jgi:hypothetical protein